MTRICPPLDVIYHVGPCIGVNKPSGILTQAPPGVESLENQVRDYIKSAEGTTGNVYLGVPHRLDRPASGVLLFGRHVRATRRLAKQFETRSIRKTYWAIVPAADIEPAGSWCDTLRKIPGRSFVEVVDANHAEGKSALLDYQIIWRDPQVMLLEIELQTGRTHQIRVQAASRGLPIVGDEQYGSSSPFGPPWNDARDRAIALHARRIAFEHPMTAEPVEITAPLPATWNLFGCDPHP